MVTLKIQGNIINLGLLWFGYKMSTKIHVLKVWCLAGGAVERRLAHEH
jgi:hypothetical protein